MIIWTIKLLSTFRRAIAGRKYPHQLAWAVAFGLLLGIVPHGNLLALGLLIVVLSLKLNHAMAGLTAIGASFAATIIDPYSHQLGESLLNHPEVANVAANAWQLPLVPWTDLNNTVVMGSFLIGMVALLPVFAITYPIFRLFAPAAETDEKVAKGKAAADRSLTHEIVMVDQGHAQVARPHRTPQDTLATASSDEQLEANLEDAAVETQAIEATSEHGNQIAVETRIDVIRMKDYRDTNTSSPSSDQTAATQGEQAEQQQPMDEALNYLLRQLRDSQQRKVA